MILSMMTQHSSSSKQCKSYRGKKGCKFVVWKLGRRKKKKMWSPDVGLEPTTLGLRVPCSTDWANRAVVKMGHYLVYWCLDNSKCTFSASNSSFCKKENIQELIENSMKFRDQPHQSWLLDCLSLCLLQWSLRCCGADMKKWGPPKLIYTLHLALCLL